VFEWYDNELKDFLNAVVDSTQICEIYGCRRRPVRNLNYLVHSFDTFLSLLIITSEFGAFPFHCIFVFLWCCLAIRPFFRSLSTGSNRRFIRSPLACNKFIKRVSILSSVTTSDRYLDYHQIQIFYAFKITIETFGIGVDHNLRLKDIKSSLY
jgi:hypothetical protein